MAGFAGHIFQNRLHQRRIKAALDKSGNILNLIAAGVRKGQRFLQLHYRVGAVIVAQIEGSPAAAGDFGQGQQIGPHERKSARGLADVNARQNLNEPELESLFKGLGDGARQGPSAHLDNHAVDLSRAIEQLHHHLPAQGGAALDVGPVVVAGAGKRQPAFFVQRLLKSEIAGVAFAGARAGDFFHDRAPLRQHGGDYWVDIVRDKGVQFIAAGAGHRSGPQRSVAAAVDGQDLLRSLHP